MWSCSVDVNETNGYSDYVVIGEASDAIDGSPPDSYDVAKPPPPMVPYLRVWLNDSLPSPYDFLWKDYRHYPGTMKVWYLIVQWRPSDYSSSTTVTIKWNRTELENSEYIAVLLRTSNGALLQDMLVNNSYVFSCPANVAMNFTIIAEQANSPPETPTAPVGTINGFHGTSYVYSTSTTDPDNDTLYYRFDWGDTTTSGWLGPYQNGSSMSTSHLWHAPGSYPVVVQARDSFGHESGWSNATTVTMTNRAPNLPINASPANGATAVPIAPVLTWVGGDPDAGDIVVNDIYFGTNASPPRIVENQSETRFTPGTLSYQTTYYWKIVAKDGYGGITNGSLWSFTTTSAPSGGPGNPPGGENHPPTANASASEQSGFVGVNLIFNGSRSTDSDGYIAKWSWDFGDGTSGNGEVTTHSYQSAGTYTVILTVFDNGGASDTGVLQVVITTVNHGPTKPSLQGTTLGVKNTPYPYSMVSTDLDNDFLQYLVGWGDGTSSTSDFLPNGTLCSLSHSWSSPGKYVVTVIATDNITFSDQATLTVFIDVHFVSTLGFLLDNNSDSVYDVFFINATGVFTSVQNLANGSVRIDSDGDGVWNYNYNPKTGALSVISGVAATGENQYIFFIIIGIAIVVVVGVVYWYKKRYS
jgi:LPXTG-motif cell wall-anchored protein